MRRSTEWLNEFERMQLMLRISPRIAAEAWGLTALRSVILRECLRSVQATAFNVTLGVSPVFRTG